MADNRIRCSVNNCHYWKAGNYCAADQIMVTSNAMSDTTPHGLNALQASSAPPTPAKNPMETCCKTFVARTGDAYNDGIRRME